MPTQRPPKAAALSLALCLFATQGFAAESQQITFNSSPSTIVCAVLHVCDIELQPGEVITDLQAGDRARWSITPAITNVSGAEIHHLVVRPYDVGLETSVVVSTNRRTYHLLLKSDASRYMPRVTFTYPEEAQRKLESRISKELHARQKGLIPETNQYLGDLDFKYKISGDPALKPLRVYNDHLKTNIELPATATANLPTLLVTEAGRANAKSMNYSRQGNRLVVDGVFDAATLVYGSGPTKGSVTIERMEKAGSGRQGTVTAAPMLPPSATAKASAPAVSVPAPDAPLVVAAPQVERQGGGVTPGAPAAAGSVTARPTPVVAKPAAPVTPPQQVSAAPAPAATPPLASKPAAPVATPKVWEARTGSTLRATVAAWAAQEKYDVDWLPADLDYPIEAPLRFEGSFESAVSSIFRLYDKADRSFIVDGRRAQKRLIVQENLQKIIKGASQ
ncbi:P-type conjugative transfer protein TrbG [Metapseudomonas furukawaii]|nr:P-type conjugative transfer protein TrbG [Pseudomonas furukawaii]